MKMLVVLTVLAGACFAQTPTPAPRLALDSQSLAFPNLTPERRVMQVSGWLGKDSSQVSFGYGLSDKVYGLVFVGSDYHGPTIQPLGRVSFTKWLGANIVCQVNVSQFCSAVFVPQKEIGQHLLVVNAGANYDFITHKAKPYAVYEHFWTAKKGWGLAGGIDTTKTGEAIFFLTKGNKYGELIGRVGPGFWTIKVGVSAGWLLKK